MVKVSDPLENQPGDFREDLQLHWLATQPGQQFDFRSQYPDSVVFHSQQEDERLLTLTMFKDESGNFASAQLTDEGNPHFSESISVGEAQALILPAARQEWYAQDFQRAIENNKTTDDDPSEKEPAWIKEARKDYLEAEPATAQEIREKVARQQAMRPLGIEGNESYSERVPRPETVAQAGREGSPMAPSESETRKGALEAYRIGYLLQMQRLEDGARPETMADATKIALDAAAIMPNTEMVARMAARKSGDELTVNGDFRNNMTEGQHEAALDWLSGHAEKLQLADSLTAWIKTQDTSKFEVAEVAIARNLARQMVDGNTDIDLTQRYATDVSEAATNRHDKAVANLTEHIKRAAELGFSVNTGQALTQVLRIREVLAVSERIT